MKAGHLNKSVTQHSPLLVVLGDGTLFLLIFSLFDSMLNIHSLVELDISIELNHLSHSLYFLHQYFLGISANHLLRVI